jgi:triphosphatase
MAPEPSPPASDNGGPVALQSPATNEVELKLLAPPGSLAALREAPAIARYARNAGVTRQLQAAYYDTPDRALYNNGLSLRVRRSGKRHVQTLKRAPAHGQPFARQEWEGPVSSMLPDPACLPVAEIGAPLDGLAPGTLEAVFTTKVRRRTQHLELPGAIIEVAFDEGVIEAGARSEPLAEIEFEVKAGDASVIYDLGAQLLEIAPLRVGTLSKSDRGYALAYDLKPEATKAQAPDISPKHTLDELIPAVLGSCQHHVLANQANAIHGNNAEAVHQMRVGLRRLRTACALLHRELGAPALQVFAAEAQWMARLLGAARDWDVFVTETLHAPTQAGPADVDLDALRHAAAPHRAANYAAVQEAIAQPRYNRFQLSLSRWLACHGWRNELDGRPIAVLTEAAPVFAERVLARSYRKALRRGAHFASLAPKERHKLRIALKKLRYAAEFFQVLYANETTLKRFLKCVSHFQDALGHDNDVTTTHPLLQVLITGDPMAPEVHRAIGVVIGWQARDRIAVHKSLRKLWRKFKTMPAFWPI